MENLKDLLVGATMVIVIIGLLYSALSARPKS
jgi:hypothetical protein